VFFTTAGFMNWLNFQRIFKALGYDFKHVQIDPATQADALKAGTIVGAVAYTTAGASLASYWRETDIRTDVSMVNPCPDEIAKLKAAGLGIAEVDPSKAFSKPVGVDKILGVPILFGYNMRADMPEDVVYKMLTAFYKHREELAKADPGFTPMARTSSACRSPASTPTRHPGARGPREVPAGPQRLERQVESREK
jgi:uncharacterized protein